MTAVVESTAKFCAVAHVEETEADYLIPRQSVSRKQMLDILPNEPVFADINGKQLATVAGDKQVKTLTFQSRDVDGNVITNTATYTGKLVEFTNLRLVERPETTLLRRGDPFKLQTDFKRQGSIQQGANKRTTMQTGPEVNPIASEMERYIGLDCADIASDLFPDTDEQNAEAFDAFLNPSDK